MRKKGQAEIFGLIIIVLLLIFAFIFFVKTRQDDTSTVTIRSNLRANNLLNAIISFDTNAEGDMKEMLKDCADNVNYCSRLDLHLRLIFEGVLLGSEDYKFEVLKNNGVVKTWPDTGGCEEGITASPVRLPGGYVFKLKLCST